MRLSYECVREVLLSIEKLHQIAEDEDGQLTMNQVRINTVFSDLPKFKEEDILYTVLMLDQAGYIDASYDWLSGNVIAYCDINRMNYKGHELLDKIRDGKRWSIIKKALSSVRDYSLDAIKATAEGVTGAAITALFSSGQAL